MKKFIIEESEVKRILSMHRVVKEQTGPTTTATPGTATPAAATPAASTPAASTPAASTPAASTPAVDPSYEKLQKFRDANCFSGGGVMYRNKTKNTYFIRAVKQSTKEEINFFPDMTYSFVVGPSPKKGKWDCAKLKTAQGNDKTAQETQTSPQANAKTAQETQTSSQINIERTKKEGGWKERKDITDTDANLENPKMYEKTVVNGVTLYRNVASSGITGDLTDDQKKIIKKWESQGAKLRKELDPEQAKTWAARVVSPASEGYFSQDLIMYFDPTETVKKATITTTIQNSVQKRIPTDKKDCKNTIEVYFVAYENQYPLEPNEFEALKYKTQACKNQFYKKWGKLFPGGGRMDRLLDIMMGGIGGPSSYGDDAKWRLSDEKK
jgi:hypothetical protein